MDKTFNDFETLMTEVDDFVSQKEAEKANIKVEDVANNNFQIETKDQADYFIKTIKANRAEIEKVQAVQKQKKEEYCKMIDEWAESITKPLQNNENFLIALLNNYASKQLEENPKTKTIKLPYGKLSFKKQPDKYEYDEVKIKQFLHDNNLIDFIKTKEEINKVELKKNVDVKGEDAYLNNTLVPGLTVLKQPDKFEVK